MSSSFRDQVRGYSLAILATIAATWMRGQLDTVLDNRVPFGFYFLSVLLTAGLGGTVPAIFALILGILAAAHFVIPPEQSLLVEHPADKFALMVYFVVGATAIALFHRLTAERRRSDRQLHKNRDLSIQLREADRRKDEFIALLAHELRNPLAPIRASLDLLDRGGVESSRQASVRKTMRRQLDQLIRIVDDLLDVSRFLRGQLLIRKESVDMRTVVEMATETVQPLIDEQQHDLRCYLPREPAWVAGDALRLTQVVSNLMTNAAKYTPRNGRIQVQLETDGGEVSLQVMDNGIGIPREAQTQVFDLFAQADPSNTREHGGLGLGLAIVRQLTELHGGRVDVHSEGAGRGSRFTVTLPAAAAPAVLPEPGRSAAPTIRTKEGIRGRRVLIIDDNADVAETLAALLAFDGLAVFTAADGPSGLQSFDNFKPEVVLLDLGLPGMDGYEVARRIRSRKSAERPIIIAVSGWGGSEVRLRTVACGFDHHMVKPVDIAELQRLLGAPDLTARPSPSAISTP